MPSWLECTEVTSFGITRRSFRSTGQGRRQNDYGGIFRSGGEAQSRRGTPLAVGDSDIWATSQLFETCCSERGTSRLGRPLHWKNVLGRPQSKQRRDLREDPGIIKHRSLRTKRDQAVKAMMEGRCGFTVMGDWTYGELVKSS